MSEYPEYDYMECCASGSCEVCGGLQGVVRAAVRAHAAARDDDPQEARP